jgi:hypothetical protein
MEANFMKTLLKYYAITSIVLLVLSSFILDGFRLLFFFSAFDIIGFVFLLYLCGKKEVRCKEKLWGITIPVLIFICCVLFADYFH